MKELGRIAVKGQKLYTRVQGRAVYNPDELLLSKDWCVEFCDVVTTNFYFFLKSEDCYMG